MTRLILCSTAEVDFTASLCWYAERSKGAANDFEAAVDAALDLIANDPERFPRCGARHHFFLMRRFPFRIIYRIVESGIVVIAIAHASREPEYWADR